MSPSPSVAPSFALRLAVALQCHAVAMAHRSRRSDRGQSTAEYALVMLGAAAVALMLVTWASRTDKIGRLLDGVLDSILSRFS